ncbi:MAG: ATP-binding cassette domain-containing protein [Alistipes sp.]|nr:ATP-binding cassette domain-containing protein [Candidatus Alistipes equi]
MASKTILSLKDVAIYYPLNPYGKLSKKNPEKDSKMVIHHINLEIEQGEVVYFIGRVGSGKSSLLRTIYAENKLLEGEGTVAGFSLRDISQGNISRLRQRIGIVSQDNALLMDKTVRYNLDFILKATGWTSSKERQERIEEVLEMVEMSAQGERMTFELSGGERQRVAIARALINSPKLILADEPITNLDPITGKSIIELFYSIAQKGTAIIIATHNTTLLENYASRTILFQDGTISQIDLASLQEV